MNTLKNYNFLSITKEFISFLKKPIFLRKNDSEFSIRILIHLLLLNLPLDFLFAYIDQIKCIQLYFGITENLTEINILKEGFVYALVEVAIIAPLIEEYMSRYYLNKFIGNLVYVFINTFIILFMLFSHRSIPNFIVIGSTCLLTGFLVCFGIKKKYSLKRKALKFFNNNFIYLFYLSAISFGVLHLSNYNFNKTVFLLPIILVLPQIIAGFFLGYIRLKYGIRYSILFHALHNLFFIVILFIL